MCIDGGRSVSVFRKQVVTAAGFQQEVQEYEQCPALKDDLMRAFARGVPVPPEVSLRPGSYCR